jgi:hypothetical protein
VLCQIELLAYITAYLLGFAVKGMFAATWAIFLKFNPARIVAAVFFGRVIPFLAITARQGYHRAYIFLLCHFSPYLSIRGSQHSLHK